MKPPPFQVRTFGRIQNDPKHSTLGSKQGDMMLTLVQSGIGYYDHKGQTITLSKNMIGIVPDNQPGFMYSDSKTPYSHIYCRFSGDYANYLAQQIIESHGRFHPIKSIRPFIQVFRNSKRIFRKDLPNTMGEHELALARVLTILTSPPGKDEKNKALEAIDLYEYIQVHIAQPIDLSQMAQDFNISKTSLCRLSQKLLRKTIVQAYEEVRIEHAKKLMQTTQLNINETGIRVGYEDPYYFSKVFKKCTGLSPKHWRDKS